MTWLFIVVLVGIGGANDVKFTSMTEAQCRAAVDVMQPLKARGLGAACVGPAGETYEGGK